MASRLQLLGRKGKAKKIKYSLKSSGHPPKWRRIAYEKNRSNKQYTPCECKSSCGKECPCIKNSTCEKYCGYATLSMHVLAAVTFIEFVKSSNPSKCVYAQIILHVFLLLRLTIDLLGA